MPSLPGLPVLVTVDRFTEPWEAHLLRMRLEAEDIPAFVTHEYHVWAMWPYALALGGAKVQVPIGMRDYALEIRQMCSEGYFRTLLEEMFGDLDDVHCPHCSSRNFRRRTSIFVAVAAALSTLCAGAMFPARATIYDCENCTRSWRRALGIPVYEASLVTLSFGLAAFLVAMLLSGPISSWSQGKYEPPTYPFSRYPSLYPVR